ncbi:hypothetical protein L346_02711 [Pseudomonas aeruginosa MSH-10]|uniref:hypothetical protein n=1 Tax=Pseudomonas aeruginosa TaxID=287 RepID=UPI00033C499F|nr:hypothetical protein [Pseudomonas aeruginosa]EOT15959.1 hypothetical protein L346_02711 [Pseudomonas aeruginosa MSH-10]ERX70864.1 hypothetical protein P999_01691 [Pseudomonas aeruginosa MSH3]ERZ39382.1 hypothetical protein Q000_02711 [Pseudomonas aeruginosa MSH10]RUE54744.1 hypothetical protein IPC1178_22245 [Pseudomonas aeruginosa]RUE88113.1 hypothetical protein IPC1179_17405 [Pseudomonas aeruginosa]
MKERPILFTGPMVRALLEGRKTATRRIAKPVKHPDLGNIYAPGALVLEREPQHVIDRACPYGQPGDRLWVRETWTDVNLCGAPALAYRADEDIRDLMEESGFLDDRGAFNYDDPRVKPYPFACWYADLDQARWRPSIHMPRWAFRILLEITAVRVERLQDISDDQAEAEGVERPENITNVDAWDGAERELFNAMNQPRARFRRLWSDINGSESWDSNPWVWCIEFKRVTP